MASLATGTIEILPTLLGDANLDGTVNFSDYQILLANFNQTGTSGTRGISTTTARPIFGDYQILLSNYSRTPP